MVTGVSGYILRIVNNRTCTLREHRWRSQRRYANVIRLCEVALRHARRRTRVRRVTLYWGLDAWPRGALSPSARPGAIARSGRPFPAGRCPTHVPNFVGEIAAVAVKIRLKRLGKIREPYYRVVVADSRTKRDGRAIEEIGKYHPKLEPSLIDINSERVQYWLSVGAQPTDQVRHLLTITGDWQKFKGLPGTEGTLKTGETKADKKDRYEELVKESLASKEAKAAAKPARSAPKKAEPKKAEPGEAAPLRLRPRRPPRLRQRRPSRGSGRGCRGSGR